MPQRLEPDVWFKRIREADSTARLSVVHATAIDDGGYLRFPGENQRMRSLLFHVADDSSLRWFYHLNQSLMKAKQDKTASVAHALSRSGYSYLLLAPPDGGEWVLYSKGKKSSAAELVRARSRKQMSIDEWAFENLGFNGRILEINGPYILVVSPIIKEGKNLQGIVFLHSQKKPLVNLDVDSVSSILHLRKSWQNVAVFESLIELESAKSQMRSGDKVFLVEI